LWSWPEGEQQLTTNNTLLTFCSFYNISREKPLDLGTTFARSLSFFLQLELDKTLKNPSAVAYDAAGANKL
jgi:hypothetical protein